MSGGNVRVSVSVIMLVVDAVGIAGFVIAIRTASSSSSSNSAISRLSVVDSRPSSRQRHSAGAADGTAAATTTAITTASTVR